jgi:hypothetical protein
VTNNFDLGRGGFLGLSQLPGANGGLGGLLDENILFNAFLEIEI